jgi:transcription initiation factor TFIIIB Brf1 subunit/transcription initiation factor TFIIB
LSILHRITPEEITNAAKAVWQEQATAEKIALETLEIMTKASKQKFSFFNGKTSKSLVGGLFYILGYKHDAAKTQKELAAKLHTTDTTIRHSARKWLQEFSELFPDVINKLAEQDKLAYCIRSQKRR